MSRKVLLIVIDALTSRVVEPAVRSGQLPTLKRLIDTGGRFSESISSFPSITPTATSSIVTGEYPIGHNIAGAFWRDGDDESIAYYGDDLWALMNKGVGEYFDDYLLKLNGERLKAPTLFEQVESAGLTAACINYMWFHGNHRHEANTPLLLDLMPGVRSGSIIRGPSVLALADFVAPKIPGYPEQSSVSGGVLKRFGFHDDVTGDYLMELTHADPFPDFTLAYFPNNDFESHKAGPEATLPVVESVDRRLGEFIETMGGFDQVLDEFCIIVTGDHAHSDLIKDVDQRGIPLEKLLCDFNVAKGGSKAEPDQLLVCPNMRAAQIYTHRVPDIDPAQIAIPLLHDDRVDQFIVRDRDDGQFPVFYVATRDRGTLRFNVPENSKLVEAEHGQLYQDDSGNLWSVSGSLKAIDATVTPGDPDGITYADYPNALERIASGFCESSADIWVTARPGFEFSLPETTIHEAASHGSLHAMDSISPLITAGLPSGISLPGTLRIVEIAPLCRRVLGVPTEQDDRSNLRTSPAMLSH